MLPPFDELKKLDKEEIYKLRDKEINKLLDSCSSEEQRNRLKGLQFKVDVEIKKSKTPLAACINISNMMKASLNELKDALNGDFEEPESNNDNIIKFNNQDKK